MKISEFAEKVNVSQDTLRYYEKIGLLKPTIVNKQRNYTNEDKEVIQTIIKLKMNGFSLQEIKAMFDLSKEIVKEALSSEDINNIFQLREMFNQKYSDMIEREKQIKDIKEVLIRAMSKIDWLLDKTNHLE
ncbi:MerR family transcriptional regulator [Caldifermentibacillus hisashii]|uniref:helix-turn-helix domain-containing protein n=1 Tax=Caldifermentibacillus hisashii TaxID=996558 RepID=UPI003368D19E